MTKHDTTVRVAAHDRLFAAELADALDVPVAAVAERSARPARAAWLAAALVLLGAFVASGVAWLRAREDATGAQQPHTFDPVFPWYERDFPWHRDSHGADYAEEVAAIPAGVDSLTVVLNDMAVLDAVARRKGTRVLHLVPRANRGPAELGPDVWRAVGAMPDLEVLMVTMLPRARVEDLRELRAAPKLRALVLGGGSITFDERFARAILELPRLATLMLSELPLTAEGLAALAGLPHLEALLLDQAALDEELMAAVATLRGLRLVYLGGKRSEALSVTQMQQLGKLPRLESLVLFGVGIGDPVMRQLPATLQSLALPSLRDVTPEGLRCLALLPRLRALSFQGVVARGLEDARLELVRKLALEQFDMKVELPSPQLWEALRRSPKLRGMTVACRGSAGAGAVTAECAKLLGLERLTLACSVAPQPEELAPLAAHPRLRRIDIKIDGSTPGKSPPEQLDALRSCLGPKVEVVFAR